MQVLSGHLHKGYDWEGLYPFPHLTLPATRFDADNFLLLDLYRDGSFRYVVTWRWGRRCGAGHAPPGCAAAKPAIACRVPALL